MRKYIATLIIAACCVLNCNAQQEFMVTQYMFNGLAMNPAYAGIHDGLSLSALTRHQWVGVEGAPTTQFVSIHGPLRYQPISLGALVYRDVIGVKKEHTAYFSYAYRLRLTEKIRVSLALQANVHQYNQEFIFGIADDANDPILANGTAMKFNAGSGFLVHSDDFYVGFSVPQMLDNKLSNANVNSDSRLVRHYYLMGGYIIGLQNDILLKPNFLVKAVGNAPAQLDLNLNVLLKRVLWVGFSHRWKESWDLLAALQIGPRMQLGYAFDLNSNDLNHTSHELMINYIIDVPTSKIVTPRYF